MIPCTNHGKVLFYTKMTGVSDPCARPEHASSAPLVSPLEDAGSLEALIPRRSSLEVIGAACDMHLGLLLRNMTGASPELGTAIRAAAESAALANRPLEVLESGDGPPLKTLYFQNDTIRSRGDFMLCGPSGPHMKPAVHSTVISSRDYVGLIMTDEQLFANESARSLESYVVDYLNQMTGYPATYKSYTAADKALIQAAYEAQQRDRKVTLIVDNPITALQDQYGMGNRYDLIFPDVPAVADRTRYLQAIQACLLPGGRAFVPVGWWRPNSMDHRDGVSKLIFLDDCVDTSAGDVPLEDYLSSEFPEAFQIAHYPGARTLVVAGTERPIKLPGFDAQLKDSDSVSSSVSIRWTPIKS